MKKLDLGYFIIFITILIAPIDTSAQIPDNPEDLFPLTYESGWINTPDPKKKRV